MIDRRVRLRPKPAAEDYVYGSTAEEKTLMSILRFTNGLVWNYTPTITETRQVNYELDQPVHTNSGYNNYKNSPNPVLTVQGTFYAGTGTEALYLLACITFLRSVTLMDFGRKAAEATDPNVAIVGTPPPVLLFSAYGRYMYNDIPVIVKNVSFNYPDDVSYVQVPLDSTQEEINVDVESVRKYYQDARIAGATVNKENEVWVPNKMTITIQLEQQPTPDYMSRKFNLNEFKRGSLLRSGGFI